MATYSLEEVMAGAGKKTYSLEEVMGDKPNPFSLNTERVAAVGQGIKDAAGGFARSGMGVASNLMRPFEALIPGGNDASSGHDERMARVNQRFVGKGYDPQSMAFQGGKLAGDVAITAPLGGVLAKAVPLVSKAPAATKFANALRTGGFSTGAPKAATLGGKAADMAIRSGAGGITGGAMTGLVDPESAGTGAVIGAAMPPALKAVGEAGKLAKRGASALARNTLGLSTGTGADAVSMAYQSGKAGNRAFLDNMRGGGSTDDIVGQAKAALQNMRAERAANYRSGMVDIANDKTVIDFAPISDAMNSVSKMGSYKGQQINKNAAGTVQDLSDAVNNWASLDPTDFHTPEGLDALKQAIGDIRDSTQFGTAARRAADSVYNSVKNEISKQAPTYAKVMKGYTDASEALREVEKTFSMGEKASKDTALRKLLSLMRNNVNTNFSNRTDVAKRLADHGAADLLPSIAGKSMSSATPRGLQAVTAAGTGLYGATNPAYLAALPFQSPRLMGEAAYGLGRVSGGVGAVANRGQKAASLLATQHPGLLSFEDMVLRSIPLVTTSATR